MGTKQTDSRLGCQKKMAFYRSLFNVCPKESIIVYPYPKNTFFPIIKAIDDHFERFKKNKEDNNNRHNATLLK